MLPPVLLLRSLEGVIHLAHLALRLQPVPLVPLLRRLVPLALHRRCLDLLGHRDLLDLLALARLILSLILTRTHSPFPSTSASANMNTSTHTSSMVTKSSWNTKASAPCTTNTLLCMSILTILTTIIRARIMTITLMTTILVVIRNLFAIITLKTYTQPNSLTTSITILTMTLAVILPLTNSSMGDLVVNSKESVSVESVSVASKVLNAKGFRAIVQKGQNLERTTPSGRTRLQSPQPRRLTLRLLNSPHVQTLRRPARPPPTPTKVPISRACFPHLAVAATQILPSSRDARIFPFHFPAP